LAEAMMFKPVRKLGWEYYALIGCWKYFKKLLEYLLYNI